MSFFDKPMAANGLISYRAKGRYGYIMIGAKDDDDAWREARRSTDNPTDLEIWDGEKYIPVHAKSPKNKQTPLQNNFMAKKKSPLSKALAKRAKKSPKKGIKQAAPQSETYSTRKDKKEKAKPAGYRFKGLDNFATPTKKQIAADAGKPKSKRKTYFENRKDKSDKKPSEGFAKGGKVKDLAFETSNLYLLGKGHDSNGNFIVKVGFPNDRGFSIQTLGVLPNTNRIMHSIKKLSDITADDMVLIEAEVNEYVKEFGSDKQKKKLRLYNKFAKGGYLNKIDKKRLDELYAKNDKHIDGAMRDFAGELGIFNLYFGHKVDPGKKQKWSKGYEYLYEKEGKKFEEGGIAAILQNVHETNTPTDVQGIFEKGGVLSDKYHQTFRLKGNGRREYNIFQPHTNDQLKQAAKQLFPNMPYDEHKKLAGKYSKKAKEAKKSYNEAVENNFQKEFGRKPEFTDYKVSGIWTDEFSESAKQELREKIRNYNQFRDAFHLHNSVLKKADKLSVEKFEDGGVADVDVHSGDAPTAVQESLFASGGVLSRDQEVAMEILSQLGGARKLTAMTGAHTFVAVKNGLSFKIKNKKVNYIKIVLNSKDLYDIEFGLIRGEKYKVVADYSHIHVEDMKSLIEAETGMYLSLFEKGGTIRRPKSLEEIENDLPPNMHQVDKAEYLKTQKQILELELTGYNQDQVESLKNYAFRIISPYILDPNYKGYPNNEGTPTLAQGGPILPEDVTQADVMKDGGEAKSEFISEEQASKLDVGDKIRWKPDPLEDYEYEGIIDEVDEYTLDGITRKSFGVALRDHEGKKRHTWVTARYIVKVYEDGGEIPESLTSLQEEIAAANVEPEIKVEPEVEVKLEATQKATIPNIESAAYAENMIDFMGSNLEGKRLPNGDYVVLSFLVYPIWLYCAKDGKWYGNTDKWNSVTAMHISQSRPTPNAELLSCKELFDHMNQGIQRYDLGGVAVRQLYPMTFDNTTLAHQ